MSDSNPAENVELAAAGPAPGGRVPNDDDGCASTTPEKGVDDANAEAEGAAKSVGFRALFRFAEAKGDAACVCSCCCCCCSGTWSRTSD